MNKFYHRRKMWFKLFFRMLSKTLEKHFIIEFNMAFVYRSNIDPYQPRKTPGPAYYRPYSQEQLVSTNPHIAPFNQTSPRKLWQQNNIPGPGSYTAQPEKQQQKVLLESASKKLTLKTTIQTSIFKSGSERFRIDKENNPGPGKYIFDRVRPQKQRFVSQQTNLQKYLQSIHMHKSTEINEQLQIQGQQDTKNDLSGEERPEFNLKKTEKKSVPFNSSVERINKNRPKTSLGPGSYNLTGRWKSNEPEQKSMNRSKVSHSLIKFKRKSPVTQLQAYIDHLQSEGNAQAIKKCQSQSSMKKSFVTKKDDDFGSTVSRFLKTQLGNAPGPGDYQLLKQPSSKPMKVKKNKVSFGRYVKPSNSQAEIIISPFVVKRKEEEDKPEKPEKCQKNNEVHCSFGSNQPRFKSKIPENSGNQQYWEELKIGVGTQKKQHFGKRKSPQHHPFKEILQSKNIIFDDRPLSYAPQAHTIEGKVGTKIQKNAPFSSQAPRFQQSNSEMQIIEKLIAQSQSSGCRNKKVKTISKVQPKGLMESVNPRFDYKQKENPLSPCSYDPQQPPKKQFNQLFL